MKRSKSANICQVLAFLMIALGATSPPSHADEQIFAALAQRGLEPWPEALLTEISFTAGLEGEGVLDAEGYKIRLPRETSAQMMIVAVPGNVVIVDVHPGVGPVALSRKALTGLGIEQGDARQPMHILALRALGSTSQLAEASATAQAPREAPLPPIAPGSRQPVDVFAAEPTFSNPAPPVQEPQIPGVEPARSSDVVRLGEDVSPFLGVAATSGKLALQAGYFSNVENAGRFAEKIEALGLPSLIQRVTNADGTPRWKVLAGPFADDAARQKAKALGGDVLQDAYSITLK